jgi:hypothetical protein
VIIKPALECLLKYTAWSLGTIRTPKGSVYVFPETGWNLVSSEGRNKFKEQLRITYNTYGAL